MVVQQVTPELKRLEAAIRRVTRLLAAYGSGESGLSPSQRLLLYALEDGPLRVSDIAARLGVTLSAATGLVDRMTRTDLVARERDLGDRRVVWVSLTDDGRRVLAETDERRVQAMAKVVSPLSAGEIRALCATLERLQIDL